MDGTESIFLAGSGPITSSVPKNKLKIGEVFQHEDGTTSLNCVYCFQEFHFFDFFTEFTQHIEQHYLRNEILRLDHIKKENEKSIDSLNPITPAVEQCEYLPNIESVDTNDSGCNEDTVNQDSDSKLNSMHLDNESEMDDLDPLFKRYSNI